MCLNKGSRPSAAEFRDRVHKRNLDHLTVWHNVGMDVEYGAWAILGARQGTYMTMLTDWDYREVQWFDALEELWNTVADLAPEETVEQYSGSLQQQLDLPMVTMTSDQSKFFKHHYRSNWHNQGVTVREIDVIRKQEGW